MLLYFWQKKKFYQNICQKYLGNKNDSLDYVLVMHTFFFRYLQFVLSFIYDFFCWKRISCLVFFSKKINKLHNICRSLYYWNCRKTPTVAISSQIVEVQNDVVGHRRKGEFLAQDFNGNDLMTGGIKSWFQFP